MRLKFTRSFALLASLALASPFAGCQSAKAQTDVSQREGKVWRADALSPTQNTPAALRSILKMPEGELEEVSHHKTRTGVTHTGYKQTIDGVPVYKSYVKSATKSDGNFIQIMYLTTEKTLPKRGAKLTEKEAVDRAVTENFGGPKPPSFFSSPPKTETVYFETAAGLLQLGYVVQNWSAGDNQLYYTLVDGHTGNIVDNDLRTSN